MNYIIYFIKNIFEFKENHTQIKIGYTKNLEQRLVAMQTGSPFPLKVMYTFPTKHPIKLETLLHHYYSEYKTNGEWFLLPNEELHGFEKLCREKEVFINTPEYKTYLRNNFNRYRRKWRKNNSEKEKEKQRKYYKNNHERAKEARRKYYKNNSKKEKENFRKYCENNPEKIKDYHRKYLENNREKIYDRNRKWRNNNIEKTKEARRKYYKNNSEKIKERQRKYYEINKEKIYAKRRKKGDENPTV